MTDKEIINKLPLSGKRLGHTLAVVEECDALARIFRLGKADAATLHTAAILHDVTKEQKTPEQLALCRKYNIEYSRDDLESPKVLHSITGAAVARAEYGAGEAVCRAIRSHTTGREGMTLCEALLYLADYIEPTRSFPDCVELRRYFYSRYEESGEASGRLLNDTLLLSFDMTLRGLLTDGAYIHPATLEARNSIIRQINDIGQ